MHKTLSWAAVFLGMLLIFNLSSQVATQSNKLSTSIAELIIKVVEKVVPGVEYNVKSVNNALRKGAHFFAFLILGLLVINALQRSGIGGFRCVALALVICILYAVTDEVHQLFVPGRGGQMRDVLIDIAGSGMGIGLYWFFRTRFFRR